MCPDWADLVLVLFPFFFDRSQRGRSCCEIDSHGPRAFLGVHDEITRSQGSNGQCSNRVTHENGCYPISDTTYFNRIKLVALRMCASLCSTKKRSGLFSNSHFVWHGDECIVIASEDLAGFLPTRNCLQKCNVHLRVFCF